MHRYIFRTIWFWGIAVSILASNLSAQIPQSGAPISTTTKSGYKKSNQSKVFYYDSQWWALALDASNDRWEIWRYHGTNWMPTKVAVQNGNGFRCDAIVNPATGKLYVFSSHNTTSRFHRFSYLGGTWQRDADYPVLVSGFANPDGNNPGSLVQARNGDLWIFRINQSILQAKRSSNEGITWSETIHVKTGLKTANGITDATTFEFEGANFIGVAFGEGDVSESKFGFLRHADGASDHGWTDESAAFSFFNNERANTQLYLTSDAGNNVYMLTRNGNVRHVTEVGNSLYKRNSAGVWEKFKVNVAIAREWRSPALAIDATNNQLYVMGINLGTLLAEYKTCQLGQESSLETATVSPLFSSPGAYFDNLSVPAVNVDAIRGLMVCGDNTTANDIWFRHLPTGSTTLLTIGNVTVTANEVNANAAYTIPVTLSSNGALTAGTGTIHFRFPANTFVPNNITPSTILVNGAPCVSTISNSGTRQVSLVAPVNLANNKNFSIVFNSNAGLLNPTTISDGDNYRITVWTSKQPTQVNSPKYNIIATTTTVTQATVTLTNTLMSACSTYTVQFNLGAHGRLLSGSSTITLNFNAATTIEHGALSNVTVNGVEATAFGDNTVKTITLTAPSAMSLSNNAAVNILIPYLCNPAAIGSYTLTAKTSVETTPVTSNNYRVAESLHVDSVAFAPSLLSAPASYTIPLALSSNGGLAAGSLLSLRFPLETGIPNSIAANQVLVKDTPATQVTTNSTLREIYVTTPVNLANNENFSVVFKIGAGIINPSVAGSYSVQARSSVQSWGASPLFTINAEVAQAIATTTKSGYKKSNQSKVFYHGQQWWAIAFHTPDNRWYIWKFNGSTWTKATSLEKGLSYQWDAVLNASTGKLYLIGSNTTASDFRRYSYTAGAWIKDSGFPKTLTDFSCADVSNPVNLVQAKNGALWLFRVINDSLQTKHSSDGGVTWSALLTIKSGLNTAVATTDAVTFTALGKNYVGVAYGELDNASPLSRFGFLKHRDSGADVDWSDESAALTFFGTERAHNALCIAADQNDNVYLFTRTIATNANDARNILYKRGGNGTWFKYKVNATATLNWKSPAITLDVDNGMIYTMGVNLNTSAPEYKVCLIGQEGGLENAPATPLFLAANSVFDDLSMPAANIGSASGLMIAIDNTTANHIWYTQLATANNAALGIGNITVTSNEVNANAMYSIPLTLSKGGALAAGAGMINFIFPENTFVPANLAASAVTVDGVPATAITSNSTTRQVSIITPINLPNEHSFSVVFNPAAGLLNPTAVGSAYQITAWTSSQPAQVNSPNFSLTPATTTVTPATVAVLPSDADSLADYTLNFKLGNHGRLLPGTSQIFVRFNNSTQIINGTLSGAKINSASVFLTGNSATRQITLPVPASLALANDANVTLYLPKAAIQNPALVGDYTLTVSTSVETTAVASSPYAIKPYTGIGRPILGTTEKFDRNNQSKIFYNGGFWWAAAQSKIDQQWYLWRFDGATWSQDALIHSASKNRPDCVLDAANNRVYILLPGASTTNITRLRYSSGVWTIDSGYPYAIPDFAQSSDRGLNLARAANGDLWVFMIDDSTLYAKKSINSGQTWSTSKIAIKRHLHERIGLTDAVAFSYSGSNHLGVGYAENSAPNSIFGFLRHKNTDADSMWTDETSNLTQFANTTSDDHVSMMSHNNVVFMIVKTNGGGPNTTNIGLLRRETNGTWFQYPILLSTGWTRPALAIDATNNVLYAIGTREGGVKIGEMKKVAIGDYGALVSAPVDTIFKNDADNFVNISTAAHVVTSSMGLLVCTGNDTRDEVWQNLITLGPAKRRVETEAAALVADEGFDGVQVFPNPFNPHTSFRFKLKDETPVKLQIFNLNGQLVRTLIDESMLPGAHQKRWNGRNQNGNAVASGLYLYRLQIGTKMLNGRIQMIK